MRRTVVVYPALCRRCREAPAEGYYGRRDGRLRAYCCGPCQSDGVRASRARKAEAEAVWRAELDRWRSA